MIGDCKFKLKCNQLDSMNKCHLTGEVSYACNTSSSAIVMMQVIDGLLAIFCARRHKSVHVLDSAVHHQLACILRIGKDLMYWTVISFLWQAPQQKI